MSIVSINVFRCSFKPADRACVATFMHEDERREHTIDFNVLGGYEKGCRYKGNP